MKNALIGMVATVMLSSTVMAQEALSPVQSGDAATAAYINSLVTAINANSAALAAQTNGENQSVAGKTYDINIVGLTFEADKLGTDPTLPIFSDQAVTSEGTGFSVAANGFSLVSQENEIGKITFNSDLSINVVTTGREIVLDPSGVDIGFFDDPNGDVTTFPARPTQNDVDVATSNFTWSQTGSKVTLNIPSNPAEGELGRDLFFEVSLNGQSIQSLEPVFLDQALCVDAAGNSDATFLNPRDWTGNGVNDPYCRVTYKSQVVNGVLSNISAQ